MKTLAAPQSPNTTPTLQSPDLLDTKRPALTDAISGPNIVCVLSQLVHHGFLGGGQFDVTQVERSRFVAAAQLVAVESHGQAGQNHSLPNNNAKCLFFCFFFHEVTANVLHCHFG